MEWCYNFLMIFCGAASTIIAKFLSHDILTEKGEI